MNLPNAKTRQYLYGLIAAALTVLVVYKIVDADQVPLWLNLAGTFLGVIGTGTATVAVAKQRKSGKLR